MHDGPVANLELQRSPIRPMLGKLFESARRDVLVAAPYFKRSEAIWLSDRLERAGSQVQISFLTDLKSESILSGSLDLRAFTELAGRHPGLSVVNLPRLHAKVYVVDHDKALITSANLTKSGLDDNFEYGVFLYDTAVVSKVRADLWAYAKVGSELTIPAIAELDNLAGELQSEYAMLQRAASRGMKSRFEQKLRQVDLEFLKAQVGTRSANALFTDAILYALRNGGLSTRDLHPSIPSNLE